MIAAKMGDANASIPTPQPVIMKPMFGHLVKQEPELALHLYQRQLTKKGIKSNWV